MQGMGVFEVEDDDFDMLVDRLSATPPVIDLADALTFQRMRIENIEARLAKLDACNGE
jgi:hypothetical protein